MNHNVTSNKKEYSKFALVMLAITLLSVLHSVWLGFGLMQFFESFMGVFFLVFASFKLYNLKEFAYGFASYDIIAKKSLKYSYIYPFIQLAFGLIYIVGYGSAVVDAVVLLVSAVSSIGVFKSLSKGNEVHCVCLGNVIKLPLSSISLFEDVGMALMALTMLLIR